MSATLDTLATLPIIFPGNANTSALETVPNTPVTRSDIIPATPVKLPRTGALPDLAPSPVTPTPMPGGGMARFTATFGGQDTAGNATVPDAQKAQNTVGGPSGDGTVAPSKADTSSATPAITTPSKDVGVLTAVGGDRSSVAATMTTTEGAAPTPVIADAASPEKPDAIPILVPIHYRTAAPGHWATADTPVIPDTATAQMQLLPSPMSSETGGGSAAHIPGAIPILVPMHDSTDMALSTPPTPSGSTDTPREDTTLSSAGSRSASATSRLAEKLDLARIAAMAREFYLAQGEVVRRSTDWYREGRGTILVHREGANAAREGLAAHAADPGVVPAPEAPLRVPLTVIGTITNDRCFLKSDGGYKGQLSSLPFQKSFAQTTLTCALGPPPPEHPRLVADYNAAQAALKSILPKQTDARSGHVYQNVSTQHLRLRHAVFAPRTEATDETVDHVDDADLPAQFTIAGWHTDSTEAAEALSQIVNTHVARPLPAFNMDGDLIPPSRYVTDLRGATVLASFSVTYYNIGERRANGSEGVKTIICLDIEYMRVLIAPAQYTPKKRSAVHLTDPMSNVAKKQRVRS